MAELERVRVPGHRGCTLILPGRMPPANDPARAPKWWAGRTHGCWCSSWRKTRNGLRIWRRGAWRKPRKGELRMSWRLKVEVENG